MKKLSGTFSHIKKYKYLLSTGILFVIISNYFGILPPQIIRHAVNLIAESIIINKLIIYEQSQGRYYQDLVGYLLLFGILVLLAALLKGLFMFFMRQTIIVMSRNIEFDQKNMLFGHYLKLPYSFFNTHRTGDLMARISEDVGKVRMFVGPGLMYGINLVALFVMVIFAMVSVNGYLTFIVLLPLPLLSAGIYYVNNLILKRSSAIQATLSELTSFSQEAYSGIRVLKSFGREKQMLTQFEEKLDKFKNQQLALVKADALFFPITASLIGLSTILAVYQGGIEVAKGSITTGNIAEFIIYVNMLTWPVTSVGWVASIYQQAAASQARIDELMRSLPGLDSKNGQKCTSIDAISIKNLRFTYKNSTQPSLQFINLAIKKGETLGIVGKTGAGKSTLAHLLCRLYEPSEGQILINNQDYNALNIGDVLYQIGYVPQDVFLFSDSIRGNILMGKPNATDLEITSALQTAALWDTVKSFEKGLDTVLGERGVTLSGGQKQRLAIARTIIRKPDLYIFDDCLSTLDTATEKQILGNLKQLTKHATTIIISHRIKSVMEANQIIVLNHGQIIAKGTHQELLEIPGYYADTFKAQLQTEQ